MRALYDLFPMAAAVSLSYVQAGIRLRASAGDAQESPFELPETWHIISQTVQKDLLVCCLQSKQDLDGACKCGENASLALRTLLTWGSTSQPCTRWMSRRSKIAIASVYCKAQQLLFVRDSGAVEIVKWVPGIRPSNMTSRGVQRDGDYMKCMTGHGIDLPRIL